MIDPKSLAGIIVREHDDLEQALRYALRMARAYCDDRNLLALEYQDAAKEIRDAMSREG